MPKVIKDNVKEVRFVKKNPAIKKSAFVYSDLKLTHSWSSSAISQLTTTVSFSDITLEKPIVCL